MTQSAQDCTWLAKQIQECCKNAGEPLSDNQFMLIAGYTSIHAGLLNEMDPELFGIDGSDGQASQKDRPIDQYVAAQIPHSTNIVITELENDWRVDHDTDHFREIMHVSKSLLEPRQASQTITLGGQQIMPGDRVAFVAERHHRSMKIMNKFISDHYPAIESSGAGRVYLKTGASIHFLGKATVNRHNLRGMEFDKVLVHEEVPAHEVTSLYAELQPGIKQ